LKDVFEYIRFPRMKPTDIRDYVETSGVVPLHLILEAYRYAAIPEVTMHDKNNSIRFNARHGNTTFGFDHSRCPNYITLSGHNMTATNGSAVMCQTVLADKGFREGSHYWECVIEQTASVSDIMIGVVDDHSEPNDFLSHTKNGFAIYGNNGNKYHNRNGTSYHSRGFLKGDIIGVLLDLVKDSLWFFINGEPVSKEPAYKHITKSLQNGALLYPAVTLYAPKDRVTLNTRPPFDAIESITLSSTFNNFKSSLQRSDSNNSGDRDSSAAGARLPPKPANNSSTNTLYETHPARALSNEW